jgi:RecA/RadA recombinase
MDKTYLEEHWTASDESGYSGLHISVMAQETGAKRAYLVAEVITDVPAAEDTRDRRADAELIAAAPELLRQLDKTLGLLASRINQYRPLKGAYEDAEELVARLKDDADRVEEDAPGG